MTETIEKSPSEWRYWWVALSGFLILLIEGGIRPMLAIFFVSLQQDLNWSKSTYSTVIVVINASSLLSGPLAAMMYQMLGARTSTAVGSFLTASGYLIASMSSSTTIIICIAVVIGIGCGLMKTAIVSVQCEYFEKNRNFVMASIFIGPGIGQFIFAFILNQLNNCLSWRVSWRIIAIFFLCCAPLAAGITRRPKQAKNGYLRNFLGIEILKIPQFLVQLLAVFLAASLCISYYIFEVPLMIESGIDGNTAAGLFSSQGISSVVGRIVTSLMIHSSRISIVWVMLCSYIVAQGSMFAGAYCETSSQFLVHNVLSGYGVGMYSVSSAPFLLYIAGPTQLPIAFGYTNLINGLAGFVAMYIGRLADRDGVRAAFSFATKLGLSSIVACGLAVLLIFIRSRKEDRKSTHEPVPTEDPEEEIKKPDSVEV